MNNKSLTKIEIEMIKEYQLNKNESVPLYFYQKFSNDLANIIYARINSKFSSIPIERNDLLHLIWKGIKEELDEFNEHKKESLFNCFVQNSYQKSIREAIRFLTNGHILLNTASSIEEIGGFNVVNKTKNGVIYQEIKYHELTNEMISKITPFFARNSQRRVQRIIYLKSCGFSLNEISKKLRIPIREIRNLFHGIKIIGELLYKK